MKSREEVEKLKRDWLRDPIWDIYTTEGFEEYADELKNFQQDCELKLERKKKKHHEELAAKPCPIMSAGRAIGDEHPCMVEQCPLWNVTDESCAILSLRFLDSISDAAEVYRYRNEDR